MPRPLAPAGPALTLLLALHALLPAAASAQTGAAGEYRLKAAFLYRISQFVEWPHSALGPEGQAFAICVLGSDPFGPSLRELGTRQHGGRPIVLQYPANARDARSCQMVYVESASKRLIDELGSTLADLPVLTVSATEGFVDQGGGIGFITEQGKLRLEINVEALRRAKLKPSVKLLEVAARLVGPTRTGGAEASR
jgi:hypothetical protein